MLCNRCTGIYKFGNNTYPRRIRRRSNLGHIFRVENVRLMGQEIRYVIKQIFPNKGQLAYWKKAVLRGHRSALYRNTAKCIEGHVFWNTTPCSSVDSNISEECAVLISGKEELLFIFLLVC